MSIADGFPGQRLRVLPRPLIRHSLTRPVTAQLVVTDAGYFPHAAQHGRRRSAGTEAAIVIVCVSGSGWCRLGGSSVPVGAGRALIIPPGTGHEYGADPDDPWTIWWMHLAGTDVANLLAAARVSVERPVVDVGDLFRIVALAEDVVRRMERDETTPNLIAASGAAWNLMALLAAEQSLAGPPASPNARVIAAARETIRQRMDEPITVAELADQAGFSASHFAALFQQHTGCAVREYQTQLRMAAARELLDVTDEPVARVARRVGYRDAFYFSRHFRTVHGATPSGYRAQRKG